MKIKKDLLPIIGLVLMVLITTMDAFLLVQATGNAIYLTLAVVALPLFLVILVVLLFRLKEEPASVSPEKVS
ncbi:MAG: hypothetical protein LUQ65_13200 [Candidatus Helarchaeota archaeon]|nr:hypothetical protein [Candidatus Helarchaeota archaeon]